MAILKRLGNAATVSLLGVALAAPAFSAEITVGDFVQRLAQTKGLIASDTRLAYDALRDEGYRLPDELDLRATLTEGSVARISRAVGLDVRTSHPTAPFTGTQVEVFFVSFNEALRGPEASTMESGVESELTFDPFSKGKGKGKGGMSPTDPH